MEVSLILSKVSFNIGGSGFIRTIIQYTEERSLVYVFDFFLTLTTSVRLPQGGKALTMPSVGLTMKVLVVNNAYCGI